MGNRIGVDISGSIVRIACLCHNNKVWDSFSSDPDGIHSDFFKTKTTSRDIHISCPQQIQNDQSNAGTSLLPELSKGAAPHPASCKSNPPLTHCPYSKPLHRNACERELALRKFLDSCPFWGKPRPFCFSCCNVYVGKVFCFVVDIKHLEEVVALALQYIPLEDQTIEVTGAKASELQNLLLTKFSNHFLNLQFHREITCILEAVDFLACHVSGSIFRYARTRRALNSVLPDDEHYTAVRVFSPLEQSALQSFYPFLLVNLKAGVSFHLVTSPNESRRVGGSTIGGATFMGLLRLLCRSVRTPLDAFLLAHAGDNAHTDMLVQDIYGGDYSAIGLKGTTVASTLGKIQNALCLSPHLHCHHIQPILTTCQPRDLENTEPSLFSLSQGYQHQCSADFIASSVASQKNHLMSQTAYDAMSQPGLKHSNSSHTCSAADLAGSGCGNMNEACCQDVLCCCCGLRRWARCQVSEATAAAAAGITSHAISKFRKRTTSSANQSVSSSLTPTTSSEEDCEKDSQGLPSTAKDLHSSCSESQIASHPDAEPVPLSRPLLNELCLEATEADIARSILTMMSFNVAQLAYFNSVIHNCNRISQTCSDAYQSGVSARYETMVHICAPLAAMSGACFCLLPDRIVLVGYYLEMPGYLSSIQHCIDFWSEGRCQINFVRLATNLGALGASLRTRRRTSGAYLMDCIRDDRTPAPHRMLFHLKEAFDHVST